MAEPAQWDLVIAAQRIRNPHDNVGLAVAEPVAVGSVIVIIIIIMIISLLHSSSSSLSLYNDVLLFFFFFLEGI
jgi:hypothetical protein